MKETVIFSNMCMVYDDNGNVLVQNRVGRDWSGVTFPGGHVEAGEDFADAVIREVFEETGLTIENPRLCGVKHWYEKDGTHCIVLCYKTKIFSGTLISSEEGEMSWVRLEDIHKLKLANNMEYMLRLFTDDDVSEHCFRKENGVWVNVLK